MRIVLRLFALATLIVPLVVHQRLYAQPHTRAFDVASIKESQSLEQDGLFRQGPGRFTVTNLSLRWILRYAYRRRDYQVVQAPSWTDTRCSISATFSDPANYDDVRSMLQQLLMDRFGLRAHRETRSARMYVLTKAHADDTFGPQLSPSTIDCEKVAAERAAQGPQAPQPGGTPTCR